MYKLATILLVLFLGSIGSVAGNDTTGSNVGSLPAETEWSVTLEGGEPVGADFLIRRHVSGKLSLLGSRGPAGAGIVLAIPMAKGATGRFSEGIALSLPGISSLGTGKHDEKSTNSSVTVNVNLNTDEAFAATFSFIDVNCNDAGTISGTGFISHRK